jgi:hypothetical protein
MIKFRSTFGLIVLALLSSCNAFKQNVNVGPGTAEFRDHTMEIFTMLAGAFALGLWLGWILWNKYKAMVQGLRAENESLTTSFNNLKVENDALKITHTKLETDKNELQTQFNSLSWENADFKTKFVGLESDLENLMSRNKSLESDLSMSFASTPESAEVPMEIITSPIDVHVEDLAAPLVEMEEIAVPEVAISLPEIPEIELPEVELPKIELPVVEVPEVEVPEVELPSVELPVIETAVVSGFVATQVIETPKVEISNTIYREKATLEEVIIHVPEEVVAAPIELEIVEAPPAIPVIEPVAPVVQVIKSTEPPRIIEASRVIYAEPTIIRKSVVTSTRIIEEPVVPTIVTKAVFAEPVVIAEPIVVAEPVVIAEPIVVAQPVVIAESVAIAVVSDRKDDLKIVEGIGPKIEELLFKNGIHTYTQLAATPVNRIKEILVSSGPSYAMHDPGTWPAQSLLAANGEWENLKSYQSFLNAGKRPS